MTDIRAAVVESVSEKSY